MKRRKCLSAILCSALAASLMLAGCGSSSDDLPDLSSLGEVNAVARSEGSGTRSEFESIADTYENGADVEADSTQEVLELVAEDENAVGYAAVSEAENAEGVKILDIDGVTPDTETISEGDYPLCREYMIAWIGELNELETDFLSYVRGAGQEIIGETAIPIRDTTTFLSDKSEGTIVISGSSSMETMIYALAEDYCTYNPNAEIEIEISDSTTGINAALSGDCDLALSSRSLTSYEEELLSYKVIASDGIAIVVNENNPLTDLTLKQVAAIYDGDIEVWSDLAE